MRIERATQSVVGVQTYKLLMRRCLHMDLCTHATINESTEVQTLGAVCTTREERRPAMPTLRRRDVLLLTCVILSERGIYGSLPRK